MKKQYNIQQKAEIIRKFEDSIDKGSTKVEAAKASGVSIPTIARWKKGGISFDKTSTALIHLMKENQDLRLVIASQAIEIAKNIKAIK